MIQELEGRVQQLAQESEALQDSKSKLAKAKVQSRCMLYTEQVKCTLAVANILWH